MSIYEAWSVDDDESDAICRQVQEELAAKALLCREHGHVFGKPRLAFAVGRLFSVCERCSVVKYENALPD